MSENQEDIFHIWQPSVITVRNAEPGEPYFGNVIIGPNLSKTEIDEQVGASGALFVEDISEEGGQLADEIQDELALFIQFSELMSDTIPDLREELYVAFGEPIISTIQFTLDMSLLDSGELA